MEHPAASRRGQRGPKPFQVGLGAAESTEEGQSLSYLLAGDEPDQGKVDVPGPDRGRHDDGWLPALVRVQTILWRRARDCGREGGRSALPVRPRTQDGVGEADRV